MTAATEEPPLTRPAVIAARDRAVAELDAARSALRAEELSAARSYVAGTPRPTSAAKIRARVLELEGLLSGLARVEVIAEMEERERTGASDYVGTSRLHQIGIADPEVFAIIQAERAERRRRAADEAKAVCGDPRRTDRSA